MSVVSSPPSAAAALRASFGDRKPVDISRKITACVSCRKQKIKCIMTSEPPCSRCKKRGLSCVVNRSLQMLLENDVTWKTATERRIRGIENALSQIAAKVALPEALSSLYDFNDPADFTPPRLPPPAAQVPVVSPDISPGNRPQQGWEVVIDPDQGPAAIPASCVSEVSGTSTTHQREAVDRSSDLVSQGIISLSTAETLFNIYYLRLDHFVYRVLEGHDTLASVRASSPLLTAAICAVGALQAGSSEYESCYQAFVKQASSLMFAKKQNFDDVRALCIGAFWLNDISWNLVGAAVRIAAELNLHRCISKAPHTKRDSYVRTRLYFLVWIVDHHLSIPYGRPPMTRDFEALSSPSTFLDSEFATEDDARLISQVEIWSVSSRVFDTFGVDNEVPVHERLIPQLRRLNIALDTWRADWTERFVTNRHIGNYPRKGVGLHYQFAKLYLCSHVFRGVAPHVANTGSRLSPELEEFANAAVHAAMSILRTIVGDREIQSYLDGLPTYFVTMIAFAFVLLTKMSNQASQTIQIDVQEVLLTLDQVAAVLINVTSKMHPQHLLSSVASSVKKLVDRSRNTHEQTSLSQDTPAFGQVLGAPSTYRDFLSPEDALFMENYDFLYPQDADFNFDLDLNSFPQMHH